MADRNYRSRRERLKYGLCLNEECEKCKTKEIQALPMRKDFVCSECGKELRECPPPKKRSKGIMYAVIAFVAVLAAVLFFILRGNSTGETTSDIDSTNVDTIKNALPPVDSTCIKSDTIINTKDSSNVRVEGSKVIKEHVTSTVTTITTKSSTRNSSEGSSGKSTLRLSYGKYVGEVSGGYPNGMGRLTYSKEHLINRYDQKGRMASSGDYVIGEFVNGFLVQGKHYDSNGTLIESLIIGTAPDGIFESK